MEDSEKQDIIRAKQAISPDGLEDRTDKAATMPGNDSVGDTPIDALQEPLSGGAAEEGEDAATTHPNRNRDGKVDIGKGPYS